MRDTDDRHRYEQSWRQKRYGDDARSESAAAPPAAVQAWCFADPEDDWCDPPEVRTSSLRDACWELFTYAQSRRTGGEPIDDLRVTAQLRIGVWTSAGEFVERERGVLTISTKQWTRTGWPVLDYEWAVTDRGEVPR